MMVRLRSQNSNTDVQPEGLPGNVSDTRMGVQVNAQPTAARGLLEFPLDLTLGDDIISIRV